MNGWVLVVALESVINSDQPAEGFYLKVNNPEFIPRIGEKVLMPFGSAIVKMLGYDYGHKTIAVTVEI